MQLKSSQLKDDALLEDFYNLIKDNYVYTGNFLILLFHDAYDIITKTSDNLKIDESEEVYEYVLCAICPVSLSEPGLRYFEEENKIKARIRDWVVENPTNGFVFPAFIDRSTDVNSIMYYTKDAKDAHPELMENVLSCYSKQTAAIQKQTFQSIIKDSFSADEKKADKIFMEVQENLNAMIEEYNDTYENDTDCEPISLTKKVMQNLLIESGVPEEITTKIEKSYVENFGDDLPLVENLIDAKLLKANEQNKREENLLKRLEILQTKLDEVKQETAVDDETQQSAEIDDDNGTLEAVLETNLEDNKDTSDYDVILHVKPEKIPQIKSQIIDGQKCIVIPINENEQATINGVEDFKI